MLECREMHDHLEWTCAYNRCSPCPVRWANTHQPHAA
jgi:hypothetical protein